ncbi:hypothetical protein [Candidatus Magnetobacterium casense]|uniref:PIN domain-containing protein n=1 Tax=Candidatus Magnetobacterium casense TaxID=1455061 RepID=A0ABS6S1P4_9BACT|nr:hypothetical protein [Candidatus Magnetobacterium casensis]MBV6342765.1 hypothetical protein [Candidatus Magnetobacterium casensis]
MPSQFLLDTNAYYILFDPSCPSSYAALTAKLNYSGVVSFYISEITSMEIHSVLGKYRRKSDPQVQTCKRDIIDGNSHIQCSKTWRDPGRRRLSPNAYCTILAMLKDCEAGKGDIQATTIKVDSYPLYISW